jgi:hypothetical protein
MCIQVIFWVSKDPKYYFMSHFFLVYSHGHNLTNFFHLLSLLASTDEAVTENILKSMQTFTSLCGGLELSTPRDAFITAICKASLPAHYTLTVLNTNPPLFRAQNGGLGDIGANQYYANDWDYKHQVVVVGTPLPTSSLPSGELYQGPVVFFFSLVGP